MLLIIIIKSDDLFAQCNDKFTIAQPGNVSSSVVQKPFSRHKKYFYFKPVSWPEVFSALCSLKCVRSTIGADQLDPHLLKLAAPSLRAPWLTFLTYQIPISPSGAITSRRKSKKI